MPDRYDTETGLHILDKYADENILFDCNLSKRIRTADTIASVDEVVCTKRGLVDGSEELTVGATTFSGTTAQVRLSGGTAGEEYEVSYIVTTTGGDIVRGDGILQVH